jgi:hypothetical protein
MGVLRVRMTNDINDPAMVSRAACTVAAFRAARIDPLLALRR